MRIPSCLRVRLKLRLWLRILKIGIILLQVRLLVLLQILLRGFQHMEVFSSREELQIRLIKLLKNSEVTGIHRVDGSLKGGSLQHPIKLL